MLKPKDCKPGVEVISLTNSSLLSLSFHDYYPKPLEKYKIYTIKSFELNVRFIDGSIPGGIMIYEIEKTNKYSGKVNYFSIEHFKLIDRKQIEQFKLICSNPIDMNVLEQV